MYALRVGFILGPQANWPDSRLGPFAPRDPQFPLPGNVGVDLTQLKDKGSYRKTVAEALLDTESEEIRKLVVFDTFLKDVAENKEASESHVTQVIEMNYCSSIEMLS